MLVGDFDAPIEEKCFNDSLFQHELKSVTGKPTCFKNPGKPSCIYFILTKDTLSFTKATVNVLGCQAAIN